MKLILATALAIVSAASAAPCTSAQLSTMGDLLATNVTDACATSLKMTTSTTISTALGNPYGLCRPACATDLNSLSSGLPDCDESASIATGIANIRQICTSLANPTMNGSTCTAGDMLANQAALETPVWANCSTAIDATIESIAPTSTAVIQTLCASATCTAFLSSVEKQVPNCIMKSDTPTNSMNLKMNFQMSYGCTPAAAGTPCSLIDMANFQTAAMTPVWANCSTFLKLPQGASIKDVILGNSTTSLPAGYCTSTCPQYVLSVMKSLPSCTSDGKNVSDPSVIYTLCPNVKPENKSGASTLSVFLWSYVIVLVTAVATLF